MATRSPKTARTAPALKEIGEQCRDAFMRGEALSPQQMEVMRDWMARQQTVATIENPNEVPKAEAKRKPRRGSLAERNEPVANRLKIANSVQPKQWDNDAESTPIIEDAECVIDGEYLIVRLPLIDKLSKEGKMRIIASTGGFARLADDQSARDRQTGQRLKLSINCGYWTKQRQTRS